MEDELERPEDSKADRKIKKRVGRQPEKHAERQVDAEM